MLLPHEERARQIAHQMVQLTFANLSWIDQSLIPVFKARVEQANEQSLVDILNLFLRVETWLGTLTRLGWNSDFQAVAAGARSIFETALDLVLIEADTTGEALEKMRAFERRQVYKSAKATQRYLDESRAAGVPEKEIEGYELGGDDLRKRYIEDNREQVETDKARFWPDRQDAAGRRVKVEPKRWTGQDLGRDAKRPRSSFGFQHFYEIWYRWHCWQVHGSSLTGMRTLDRAGAFNGIAMALNFSSYFGVIAATATAKELAVETDERVTRWLGNEIKRHYPAEAIESGPP